MEYKFIFNEDSFVCAKSLDGLSNVVELINWKYGNDQFSVPGCNAFAAPSPASFTPFEELSYEQVCGWLEEANDMEALKAAVDNEVAQSEAKSNQEILPPPFSN